MACGFGDAEAISDCFESGKELIAFISDLSVVIVIPLMFFIYRMLNQRNYEMSVERRHAETAKKHAEDNAALERQRREMAEQHALKYERTLQEIQNAAEADGAGVAADNRRLQVQVTRLQSKIDRAIDTASSSEAAFWSASIGEGEAQHWDGAYGSLKVVMLGNQKGGVGKTTIAANLSAALAAQGKRILVIDLDYQHSLSAMYESQRNPDYIPQSRIDMVFQDDLHPEWHREAIVKLDHALHYLPCHYAFERVERSVEYKWVLGDSKFDIRFLLKRALRSEHIQASYDFIILDTPPRMTTGFVNAFAAATHLLIPTVMDQVSVNAVDHFANRVKRLQDVINPRLRVAGVIASITTQNNRNPVMLPTSLDMLADEANLAITRHWEHIAKPVFSDAVVPRKTALATAAAQGVGYLREDTVRGIFDNLATKVLTVVGEG